mgnify:CR=1 FL=1
MSSSGGTNHSMYSPVTGWSRPRREACSAWRWKSSSFSTLTVRADLVRAARVEAAGDPGDGQALDGAPAHAAGTSACRLGAHARAAGEALEAGAAARIAADRRLDNEVGRGGAEREGPVLALDGALLKLAHEVRLGGKRAGDDHEAGRVAVEAVDDARTGHLAELGIAPQQAVEQRAAGVARARMHDETGGLVDDDDRIVLVDPDVIVRGGVVKSITGVLSVVAEGRRRPERSTLKVVRSGQGSSGVKASASSRWGSSSSEISSPSVTFWRTFWTTSPFTSTLPSSMSFCRRARETSGIRVARTLSRRSPQNPSTVKLGKVSSSAPFPASGRSL